MKLQAAAPRVSEQLWSHVKVAVGLDFLPLSLLDKGQLLPWVELSIVVAGFLDSREMRLEHSEKKNL